MQGYRKVLTRKARHLLSALVMANCVTAAEGAAGQEVEGGWRFTSSALASLWFHGMASVDAFGPGPNPLYEPAYPGEIRRRKVEAGLGATSLDRRAGYFRDAFRRDPAFEVFHFLPLYFTQAGRTEVFSALEALAGTEEGIPRGVTTRSAFGVAAAGASLQTPTQRGVLGEFVHVLQEEWAEYYESSWQRTAEQRRAAEQTLRALWAGEFQPVLASSLHTMGFSGGTVILAQPIGAEGRIFSGSPRSSSDNVLVVSTPAEPRQAPFAAYAMLREMSFPLVRRVMADVGGRTVDPNEEENVAADAAVQVGALLLERYLPDRLPDYRRFFLSRAVTSLPAGSTGSAIDAAFQDAFPLAATLKVALMEELFSTNQDGVRE
jgi:hypothetical protein